MHQTRGPTATWVRAKEVGTSASTNVLKAGTNAPYALEAQDQPPGLG